MDLDKIFLQLVEIGRNEKFDDLAGVPEFQDHSSVCRLSDRYRSKVRIFAMRLPGDERIAFIKSIAMLEHRVGGLGSVTLLKYLLPLVHDPKRILLDWILRNTNSFCHYAYGARSVEQLEAELAWHATLSAERAAREEERQLNDKVRIARKATDSLYNAVRRGDVNAVRALILKGANASALSPSGASMDHLNNPPSRATT